MGKNQRPFAKKVVSTWVPPLDKLLLLAGELHKNGSRPKSDPIRVLVAPSWGAEGIMETRGKEIIINLISKGYNVHLRPHPRTRQIAPKIIQEVIDIFKENPNFELNENISSHEALLKSDIMICDWSGVGMEFAFGLGRPVLFIDVPRKVNNPDYRMLSVEPLEVWYREKVGTIIAPENLDELPARIDELIVNSDKIEQQIATLRNELFFNIGFSAKRGAEILAGIKNGLDDRHFEL